MSALNEFWGSQRNQPGTLLRQGSLEDSGWSRPYLLYCMGLWHWPSMHSWVAQALPQTPQLLLSVSTSVQLPAQHFKSTLSMNRLSTVHDRLQTPQCSSSCVLSTHTPPQQVLPAPQAKPQAPQLESLDIKSAQVLVQQVFLTVLPSTKFAMMPQSLPQRPQLRPLLMTLVQNPLQHFSPAAQK